MKVTFIISLIIAILVAIFAIMNGATVPVNLGFIKLNASLALVILVSVAIGAVAVYLIDLLGKFKKARYIKELEKKVVKLEKELKERLEKPLTEAKKQENEQVEPEVSKPDVDV